MSLDPSPLSPTPTPLLSPTAPVPSRGSALIGALISVVLAVIVGVVSLRFGTDLLFAPAGLKAQARGVIATSPYQIQGFEYYWRNGVTVSANQQGGYRSTDTADSIMTDENQTYHMNLVVITITLDLNNGSLTSGDSPNVLGYDDTAGTNQAGDTDTYPTSVYTALAQHAVKAGLTPVFRLDLRVLHTSLNSDDRSLNVGQGWKQTSTDPTAKLFNTLDHEQGWFNSYTVQAVKYAHLAATLNMPFFIFASDLSNLTTDTSATSQPADVNAVHGPGDTAPCTGRRECEWRHVIDAIRNPSYIPLQSSQVLPGGGYAHRLIYAAAPQTDTGDREWTSIKWFDTIDLIGIDAYFALTSSRAAGFNGIATAWTNTVDGQNLVQEFATLSQQTNKPIVFTRAGYDSAASANNKPPGKGGSVNSDQDEQNNDMGGLLLAFKSQVWWRGVIWAADYAVLPRSSVTVNQTQENDGQDWMTNTQWAGDCAPLPAGTCTNPGKEAGATLQNTYANAPIPANP